MPQILITAFEPYDCWDENASWLTLLQLTRELPSLPAITTRKYPVDYARTKSLLAEDLKTPYDFAIFLGQAPGHNSVMLESTALNVRPVDQADHYVPLEPDGPAAYQTQLPLATWAELMRQEAIPAHVSHHAGTFLCNALYYWGHWFTERQRRTCQSVFVHLPLAPQQVVQRGQPLASLPTETTTAALQLIINHMHVLQVA